MRLVLLLHFLGFSLQCFAQTCEPLLQSHPAMTEISLPQAAIDIIRNHSIYKLKDFHHQGRNLLLITSQNGTGESNLGESIQEMFLVKILKEIFPEAETNLSGTVDTFSNKTRIWIRVTDSAEFPSFSWEGEIEMKDIKVVNPGLLTIQKSQLRKQLGIYQNLKIASLYSIVFPFQQHDFRLFTETIETTHPDVIFLSFGGYLISEKDLSFLKFAKKYFDDILFLSETHENDFNKKRKKPLLILNDVKGKVPYLYALSNLAIVHGPINIFEPLSVNTPTFFFGSQSTAMRYYDRHVFSQMADIAKKTGGAFEVSTPEELGTKLKSFHYGSRYSITPPYLVKNGNKAQLEIFLDQFEKFIIKQIKNDSP